MKIKYEASNFSNKITRIEVEKETKSFVWVKGRQCGKCTEYKTFLDSWDDAKQFLLDRIKGKIHAAQGRLEYAQKELTEVEALEKPDPF